MDFYNDHILSVVLFTPVVGALLLLVVPRASENLHRVIGNIFGILGLLVSLPLVWRFSMAPDAPRFQFGESYDWIPSIGAKYSLGIDGISLLLIMLTTLLGAISILSSWSSIKLRKKEYYILFLLLQTGMLGVFMAQDFFLFYMFWEVMLVPMYFLIGVWGSDRRLYAAIKFFLYTLAGSVLMLLAILGLYFKYISTAPPGTDLTFDMQTLLTVVPHLSTAAQQWLFWGFFFAFAIKVPMFPFHTWLPDAHTEAPTAGSVILAGVLLKMGTYGFIRFSLPLSADGPGGATSHHFDHDRDLADRNYLRRAGLHDAEGHEEADRLQLRKPFGILHAGHFRADAARPFRQRDSADQSRHLDRRALLDRRRAVRAAAHAADFGIRRASPRRCRISRRSI